MIQDVGRITTAVQHCIMAIRAAGLNVIRIQIDAGGIEGTQTFDFDAATIQPEGLAKPDDDCRMEFLDSLIPKPHSVAVYDDDGCQIGLSVAPPPADPTN